MIRDSQEKQEFGSLYVKLHLRRAPEDSCVSHELRARLHRARWSLWGTYVLQWIWTRKKSNRKPNLNKVRHANFPVASFVLPLLIIFKIITFRVRFCSFRVYLYY